MNRRILIGLAAVAVLVLLGWFSISQSSKTSNSTTGAMPGMTMSGTTDTNAGVGTPGMSMGHTGAMPGMRPLVAGADGTRPSAAGLTLEPKQSTFNAGRTTQWQLHIVDKMGGPVTKFQVDQTKLMHLIVVRSDLTNYQHLHPTLGGGGVFHNRSPPSASGVVPGDRRLHNRRPPLRPRCGDSGSRSGHTGSATR